eukprot:TRINITY_DN8609_c0_g1_i1.p1 TRINITY_DN8609_c0_g1~~TRINITY_DN8609_c0_g1_i1.p1  ORF type:complete len:1677 (-),score=373.81 TRINITY_DN8609_c0_g1_i1:59-4801(-)
MGCYSALGLVFVVYSSFPDRVPTITQGILINVAIFWGFFSNQLIGYPRLRWLHAAPITGIILIVAGVLVGFYDPIRDLQSGANFFATDLFWQLLFILGYLWTSFGGTIQRQYMDKRPNSYYARLLTMTLWSGIYQCIALVLMFWVEYIPTLGYQKHDGDLTSAFTNMAEAAKCLSTCEHTGSFAFLYLLGYCLRSVSTLGLVQCANIPLRMGAFLLTSPIVVFFWAWKPEFIIFGEWDLTTWAVCLSFALIWFGHYALRYWVITEQDELGISPPVKKDTETKICDTEYPVTTASVFSVLTYSWFSDMMKRGYKKPLGPDDIWKLGTEDCAEHNWARVKYYWEEEKKSLNPSLARAFIRCFWKDLIPSVFIIGVYIACNITAYAYVQKNLLRIYETPDEYQSYMGWIYVFALFVLIFASITAHQQQWFICQRTGMRFRSAFIHLLYEKAMKLGTLGGGVGEILNLATNDAMRVYMAVRFANFSWAGIAFLVVSGGLLIDELGWAGVVSTLLLVSVLPIVGALGKTLGGYRAVTLKTTDSRIRIVNDVLQAIKLVKLYCWDSKFHEKITAIRQEEMYNLRKEAWINAFNLFIPVLSPSLASWVAFSMFAAQGHDVSASNIFSSLSLFNSAILGLIVMPNVARNFSAAQVGFNRLQAFLEKPELVEQRQIIIGGEPYLEVHDATFNIPESQINKDLAQRDKEYSVIHFEQEEESLGAVKKATLRNITLKLAPGMLLGVVGKVGSGKTTLLRSILGEVDMLSGSVSVSGTIAYAGQEAWLTNSTLRENILFGLPYDKKKYNATLDACQLRSDLAQLPGGDQTEIGERGVNLSGGQKQRVSLARAIYTNKDIYLLDDPLSAVDQHVGKAIFTQCIQGLLKNKIVVLVTNQLQYLPDCDNVLFLQDGKMEANAEYKYLIQNNQDFAELLKDFTTDEDSKSEEEIVPLESTSQLTRRQVQAVAEGKKTTDTTAPIVTEKATLIKKEEQLVGSISWRHYLEYARNGGLPVGVVVIMFSICISFGRAYYEYFLSYWVDSYTEGTTHSLHWFIGTMGGILGAYALCLVLRSFIWAHFCLTSSTSIHNQTLEKILRAPMSFFDVTPLGRIINRFSNDMDKVDTEMPVMMENWIHYFLNTISVLTVIGITVPWFTLAYIPIGATFYYILNYFIKSSRELKRIEAMSVSPLVSHISASLQGLTTIRAYGSVERFTLENIKRIDKNVAAMWAFELTGRWSGYRLDFLGCIIVFGVAAMTMLLRDTMTPGTSGMLITFSFQMVGAFQWAVRSYAETENNMAYYERLQEYNQNVKPEAERIIHPRPAPSWPREGAIEFKDVVVSYREDLKPVLKNATFSIKPREKIGIVGRTGAGKSTLTTVLFRLVEPSSGKVIIDGIDISTIGLDDLRSKLAIIPQDPVLFIGSIRSNLDPFGRNIDKELWAALKKVHLSETIQNLPGGLDYMIMEGGENFSVGQRQLVCIARALLRNSQILVLDEATASIDITTDGLIQETIRSSFSECTVLTIAHRLHTIIDSDRILMMDKGEVIEFDTPHALLKDSHTSFSRLVDEMSVEAAKNLRMEAARIDKERNENSD